MPPFAFVDYKGLQVGSVTPAEAGGIAIDGNMRAIADRAGPVAEVNGAPGVTDDDAGGGGNGTFFTWSKWRDTSNDDVYICVDPATGAAVWKLLTAAAVAPAIFSEGVNGLVNGPTADDISSGRFINASNVWVNAPVGGLNQVGTFNEAGSGSNGGGDVTARTIDLLGAGTFFLGRDEVAIGTNPSINGDGTGFLGALGQLGGTGTVTIPSDAAGVVFIGASNNGDFIASTGFMGDGVLGCVGMGFLGANDIRFGTAGTPGPRGSFAGGHALSADIAVEANGAFQWAQGVNAVANSLQVGAVGTSIHLHADGLPAAPAGGDVWNVTGDVFVRTGGATLNLSSLGGTKSITFPITLFTGQNRGDHRVDSLGATGVGRYNFAVPEDFGSLTSLELIGIPMAGAAGASKDIDLFSDYGAVNENFANHSESDTTTLYDFTGDTDLFIPIDLSVVFSSLTAGDFCGVQVDHNSIGGAIDYKLIKMVYTPA